MKEKGGKISEQNNPAKSVLSLTRILTTACQDLFVSCNNGKKKEKLKEKMDRVKWIGARAGRGSGGTSQSAGGRASGQLALLLSQEEEQRCGPRSYSAAGGRPSLSTLILSEKEDYATNSQPYSNTGQSAQDLHLPSFFYHKWKGKSNSYPFSSQKGQRSNSLPYSITRKHRSTNSCPNFTPRRWTIVYHLTVVF